MTLAQPGVHTQEHSHDGDGIRFIADGSITYDGKELTAGDWMFIPRGQRYSFDVGPTGPSCATATAAPERFPTAEQRWPSVVELCVT